MNQKSIFPFLISFLLLIAVIIINRRSFNAMRNYSRAVDHTRVVITSFEELSDHMKSAQIYSKRFEKMAEKNYYNAYRSDAESVPTDLARLRNLVADNPVQVNRIDTIEKLVNRHIGLLLEKNIAELIESGQGWRLADLFQIHDFIKQAIRAEQRLLAIRKKELDNSTNLTSVLTVVFSIVAIVIILVTFTSNLFLTRRRNWLEGFLTSILNTSQNGIITYKAVRRKGNIIDFKILFANRSIEKLLDVKPEDLVRKRIRELPSKEIGAGFIEKYIHVVETGEQLAFETMYTQGGTPKWFYVLLAKMEDGVTASFHDISDLRKYQDDLQENIRKLEISNKELEQYAYVASHDLQEPLRKIRTYADLVHESSSDEKNRPSLEKIIAAAERMSNLINDILNFSSLKRDPGFASVDLTHVLKNILIDLDLLIAEKNAVITFDQLPTIQAIPLQMHQLFYNLINNALKFTRPGNQPRINITTRDIDRDQLPAYALDGALSYCEITLKDNGIGFSQEFSEQIFGLFKRLGPKSKFGGSGIGLALCRKVVNNHRGIIFAEGRQNEGATFHIILPYSQPAD